MSEAEILYQYSENSALVFNYLQWWLGVSVGLVALGHLFAKQLTRALSVFIACLYVLYSTYCFLMSYFFFMQNGTMLTELAIRDALGELSIAGHAPLTAIPTPLAVTIVISLFSCIVLGFFGSLSYFVYRVFHMESAAREK